MNLREMSKAWRLTAKKGQPLQCWITAVANHFIDGHGGVIWCRNIS